MVQRLDLPTPVVFKPHLVPAEPAPTALGKGDHLTPLTSIRFLAALHLFLFHAIAFLSFPPPGQPFVPLDWPPWVTRLFSRGFCSTSLFFLLSGFILTYLYVGKAGNLTVTKREFWVARLARVYPLHLAVMILVTPLVVPLVGVMMPMTFFGMAVSKGTYLTISGILTATLTQAWFPEYALSWNFATWALSAVMFFYLAFPALVKGFRRLSPKALWAVLLAMPIVSLMPPAIYFMARADSPRIPGFGDFWNEFIMRTPLLWLPHFVMGMALARLFGITREDSAWQRGPARFILSWGDLAFLACLGFFLAPEEWIGRILGQRSAFLFIRHGLIAPLWLVVIYDLALDRGVLARILSVKILKWLGDASFAIFIFQLPVLTLMGSLRTFSIDPALLLTGMVVLVIGASLLSVNLFEKPVARWLRRKFAGKPLTPVRPYPGPHRPVLVGKELEKRETDSGQAAAGKN